MSRPRCALQWAGLLAGLRLLLIAAPAPAQPASTPAAAGPPIAPAPARLALKVAVGRLFTQTYELEAEYALKPRLSLTLAPRLLAGPVPEFVSLMANRAGDEAHGQALDLGGRYYLKTQPGDGDGLAGVYVGLKAEYQRLRPLYRIEMWGEDPGPDGLSYYTYRPRSFTETINRAGGGVQLGYQARLVHPRLRIDVWVSASYLRSRSSAGEATRYNSGRFDYAYSGLAPLLGLSVGYVVK